MFVNREQAREMQCPARRGGRCGRIDIALGWFAGLDIVDCDVCWAKGPESNDGEEWRRGEVSKIVGGIDLATAQVPVVLTVLGRHTKPPEAGKKLLEHAKRMGRQNALALAKRVGNQAAVLEVFGEMTEREENDALDPKVRWGLVRQGWAFAKAMTGRAVGMAPSPAQAAQRRASCAACPAATPSEKHPGQRFCNDCGCGDHEIALLDSKVETYALLDCPRRKPGFHNALPEHANG